MSAVIHTLDTFRSDVSAYLDKSERAEARAKREADAALSLRTNLLLALSTGKGRVPVVRGVSFDRIESEHISETVAQYIDYDDTAALLMEVLAHCPDKDELVTRVEALRERIVGRVVEARASDLAEFEQE